MSATRLIREELKKAVPVPACRGKPPSPPLYHDDDHLSLAGADFVAPLFDRIFKSKATDVAERIAQP